MADIAHTDYHQPYSETVLAGEKIRIQILNSDNTVKKTVSMDICPAGKTFSAQISVSGKLS